MIRIYADFNAQDVTRRVRLNTQGSLNDIERAEIELRDGTLVELYSEDGITVIGRLVFEGIWLAEPDWTTLKKAAIPNE